MRKRILSIFLVLCMVFTMLPVSAMAEEAYTNMDAGTEGPASDSSWGSLSLEDNGDREEDRPAEVFFSQALITTGPAITHYDVWVGGVQVTSENMTSVTGPAITGSVTYDPNSSTLTLDGAEITGVYADGGNQYGIYTAGNLNIELVNSYSAIETLDAENQAGDNTGIYVSGNLTISGDKTLRVTSGKANNGSNYGIRVGGNLTIDTTVITQVDSSLAESHGVSLFGEDALLTVEEAASLSATGGAAAKSYGIYLEGENARMTLKGEVGAMGSAATELSAGIFMPGVINTQITIDGSEVFAIGSSADIDSYGLLMFGDLLVKEDSQFYATAGQADNMMTGLYTKELTVDGGYVWAGTAEHDAERSFGIFGLSSITILDGALRAYSDGEGEIAQALSAVPAYGSSYIPLVRVYDNNYMGDFIADEDFNNDSISSFKQISIENNVIYDLWVGGVRVSNRNRRDITGPGIDGFISYDPENNTLTLDDAVILEAYVDENGNKYGIYAPSGDLKLELICEHSNIFLQGPLEDKDGAGIYANSNLTIFGEGKLVITGGATTGDHGDSYGIHVENGDLTVEGVELIAAGAPVEGIGSASYGICVHDGNLIIRDDASVTAIGAEADVASYGVYLGGSGVNLLVESGSSLEATGGDTEGVSYGIHMEQEANTLVIDGRVTAIGGSAEEESIGILAHMIGVNAGAILEASGRSATTVSYGIFSSRIHIYGGWVEADSSSGAEISQAMTSVPIFDSAYTHLNNAGQNGADAIYMNDAELARGIGSFRYVEITPYTPVEDNDNGGSYIPVPVPTAKPAEAVDGKTETKATVDSNGTASISITEKDITNAIANAKAEAEKNGVDPSEIKVVIHVSTEGKDATDYSLGLSKAAQQLLIDNKITGLELVFDDSDITLGINQAALTEINRQAKADVRISISKTDKSKLSTGAQDAIGDRPVYDFKATYQNGSRSVTSFGDGEVYVRIPYTPADDEDEGYLYIVYVDDQGNISRVADSTYDANSGSMIFLSNHFSVYGVGYAAPEVKLTDIDTHWAKESINYVVGRGLILGRTQTTFSPDQAITRAELVTALGKLAGIDTEEYTTNSFKDVKANSSNRPYIEWAYSKDILKGTEGQKFEPNRLVTREEMADIMANYVKAMGYKLPAIRNVLPYADASVIDSSYTDAVKSLQQAGILMGKGDNQFHPKTKASRAEVAAMLHRFIKLTIDPTSAQGWTVNDDGQMMYYRNMKLATGWQTIAGVKYFFNSDGSLKTGWVKDDSGNTRYYSGRQMLVGFWNISTKCSLKTYYFDCNGIMYSSKWLQTQDGKEYYFNTDGTLAGDIRPDVSEADETCVITGK